MTLSAVNDVIASTLKTVILQHPLRDTAMAVEYIISTTSANPKKRGALLAPRASNILSLKINALPCGVPDSAYVCGMDTGLCEA